MTIGIFGGSFNPPHIGHKAVADQILESGLVNKLLIIPTSQNPFKVNEQLIEKSVRYEMIKKTFSSNAITEICLIELEKDGASFTVDTLKELKKLFTENFALFIGDDAFVDFFKWKGCKIIAEMAEIYVFHRIGKEYNIKINDTPSRFFPHKILNFNIPEASSTKIREQKNSPEALGMIALNARKCWVDYINHQL